MTKESLNDFSKLSKLRKEERTSAENELRKHWKVNELQFIGIVSKNKNTSGRHFRNIRSISGERVRYPNGKRLFISIPKSLNLEEHGEYSFYLKLAHNDRRDKAKNKHLLIIEQNKPVEKLSKSAKTCVDKLRNEYEKTEGAPRELIVGLLRRLSAETNKKPETFIYELIQNADDYPDPTKGHNEVAFTIADGHLVLTHQGLPFEEKNVEAICKADAGDKRADLDKTGFKGIGFKSIFKFANLVWINSGEFSFRFDQNHYTKQGIEMPWQVIPIWTAPQDLKPKTKALLKAPVTIFIKPTEGTEKLHEIETIFNSVFKEGDRVLLFLRTVKRISFEGAKSQFSVTLNQNDWKRSEIPPVLVPEEVRSKLKRLADTDDRVPEKYKEIKATIIRFASSFVEGRVVKTNDTRLYAYLPTDWNLGFDFLINGDFIPDGSRDRLFDDIDWNIFLMERAGYSFIQWLSSLVQELQNASAYDIFPDLPKIIERENDRSKGIFLKHFKKGLDAGVEEIPFVLDVNGQLQLVQNIVYDSTGFSELLEERLFDNLPNNALVLANKKLGDGKWLQKLITQTKTGQIFDWKALLGSLAKLDTWLSKPKNNARTLNFLIKKGVLEKFKDEAIFLDAKGRLKTQGELYLKFPKKDRAFIEKLPINGLNKIVREMVEQTDLLGLKVYNPVSFIKEYVIPEKEQVDELLDNWENSMLFYQYLATYSTELSTSEHDKIKWFKYHDSRGNLVSSIEGDQIYFPNPYLTELQKSKALPEEHLRVIPQEYLEVEGADEFWRKLDAKQIDSNTATDFLLEAICPKIETINTRLQTLHSDGISKALRASRAILQFYMDHLLNIPEANQKSIMDCLGKLLVLTKEDELKSIRACYLSEAYTGSDNVETLIESYPDLAIDFISERYVSDDPNSVLPWRKMLRNLGCRDDHMGFVRDTLMCSFKSLDKESLIRATNLLFQYRKPLKEEISQLEDFPVITNNGIVNSSEAYFSSHYKRFDDQINSLWSSCSFGDELSAQYTDNPEGDWVEFFRSLGVNPLGESDLIERCVGIISDLDLSIDSFDSHLEKLQLILSLHVAERLDQAHYESLKKVKLLAGSGGFNHPGDILFSSAYSPKIDFESLLPSSNLAFLSERYFSLTDDLDELKSFFAKMGVLESFEVVTLEEKTFEDMPDGVIAIMPKFQFHVNRAKDYEGAHRFLRYAYVPHIDLITNSDINEIFWQQVKEDEEFRTRAFSNTTFKLYEHVGPVKGATPTFIISNPTVPNKKGDLKKPGELFAPSMEKLIRDLELVAGIDDYQISKSASIWQILGIKTELDFAACLSILKRKETQTFLKEHDVIGQLAELIDVGISGDEQSLLDAFIEDGEVLTQTNVWTSISDLFILEDGFELSATKCPWLIHDLFKPLAEVFKLRILKEEEFDFNSQKTGRGSEFKTRLIQRSKFIALIVDHEHYQDVEREFNEKIEGLQFHECKRISLEYRQEPILIEKSNFNFYQRGTDWFYRGTWNGLQAAEMFGELCKHLGLKNEKLRKALEMILLAYTTTGIHEYLTENNYVLPPDLIKKDSVEEEKTETSGGSKPKPEPEEKSATQQEQKTEAVAKAETKPKTRSAPLHETSDEAGYSNNDEKHTPSYSAEESETLKKLFGDSLSDDEKFNENMEAHIKALHYFKNKGYDIAEAEANFVTNLEKKILAPINRGEEQLTVMCRKAGRGLLYLGAYAWKALKNPATHLYVLTGKNYSNCSYFEDQISLESTRADYWVLRREIDEEITPLNSIVEAEEDVRRLQILFTLDEKKYSGIFSKWNSTAPDQPISGTYGDEDAI